MEVLTGMIFMNQEQQEEYSGIKENNILMYGGKVIMQNEYPGVAIWLMAEEVFLTVYFLVMEFLERFVSAVNFPSITS